MPKKSAYKKERFIFFHAFRGYSLWSSDPITFGPRPGQYATAGAYEGKREYVVEKSVHFMVAVKQTEKEKAKELNSPHSFQVNAS